MFSARAWSGKVIKRVYCTWTEAKWFTSYKFIYYYIYSFLFKMGPLDRTIDQFSMQRILFPTEAECLTSYLLIYSWIFIHIYSYILLVNTIGSDWWPIFLAMIAIMEPGLNANFVAVVGIGWTDRRTISNCGIIMIQIILIRVPRYLLGTLWTAIVELRINTFANFRYNLCLC